MEGRSRGHQEIGMRIEFEGESRLHGLGFHPLRARCVRACADKVPHVAHLGPRSIDTGASIARVHLCHRHDASDFKLVPSRKNRRLPIFPASPSLSQYPTSSHTAPNPFFLPFPRPCTHPACPSISRCLQAPPPAITPTFASNRRRLCQV